MLQLKDLKLMSWEKIEKLQNIKLQATTRFLLSHTKAYQEIFDKTGADFFSVKKIEDWKKLNLPLIKKIYYLKNPKDFLVKVSKEEAYSVYKEYNSVCRNYLKILLKSFFKTRLRKEIEDFFTPKTAIFSGGTESGNPTPIFLTTQQKQKMLPESIKNAIELMEQNGLNKIIGMNLFPYGPHLAWHAVNLGLELKGYNMATAAGGSLKTEQLVELAKNFKPNIFVGMNEYLKNRFLPEAIKNKVKLNKKVFFINGATKMYDIERKKIINLFRKLGSSAKVLDMYGASELKECLLPECSWGKGFHNITPLSCILKSVLIQKDEKDLITEWTFSESDGRGVVWNIDGAGTLLEGYLLGDLWKKISYDKCKNCGLNVQRIFEVDRARDVKTMLKVYGFAQAKIKGSLINLSSLREKVLNVSEECQIIVRKTSKKDELIIKVVKANKQKLNSIVKILEITPKIENVSLNDLRKDKIKFEGIIFEFSA